MRLRKGYSTTCLLLFEILQELHRITWWIEELSVLHSSTDVSHGSSLPLHCAVGVMFTVHHLMTIVPWKQEKCLSRTYQIFHDVSEAVGHKIRKKLIYPYVIEIENHQRHPLTVETKWHNDIRHAPGVWEDTKVFPIYWATKDTVLWLFGQKISC